MRLSEDRISHVAHLMSDGIWKDDLVDFEEDDKVLSEIKKIIADYLSVEDRSDEAARAKIRSLSREVPEGSKEWEILYRKYLDEELAKHGR